MSKKQRKIQGYTLWEMLISILLIVSLTYACCQLYAKLLQNYQSSYTIQRLLHILNHARVQAMLRHQTIILCPSSTRDPVKCSKNWNDPLIMFIEPNIFLAQFTIVTGSGVLSFHNFPNLNYVRFNFDGSTDFQNGRFVYCVPNAPQETQVIFLNQSGRARRAELKELRDLSNLNCG